MADIFLSYAREDLGTASKLAALLQANGLSVWWDRRLTAGDEINDAIEKAIIEAKAVVVLWSPSSVGSRWVRGEAETAAEGHKLIPVKIADCKLPLAFRGLHTPDVFASRQQIDELAEMLSEKLRPGAPAQRKVSLTVESSGKFLADLKGVLTEPSASFEEQFKREWELLKRYPLTNLGVGLAFYAVCFAVMIYALELDFATANSLVTVIAFVVYFAYRHYRLSRAAR